MMNIKIWRSLHIYCDHFSERKIGIEDEGQLNEEVLNAWNMEE